MKGARSPYFQPGDDEDARHDRWIISYADFVTLLFAFFVVLYASSSIHNGKLRVLADSLLNAFNRGEATLVVTETGSDQVTAPTSGGRNLQTLESIALAGLSADDLMTPVHPLPNALTASGDPALAAREIFGRAIEREEIIVSEDERWLQLTLGTVTSVRTDDRSLAQGFVRDLGALVQVLEQQAHTTTAPTYVKLSVAVGKPGLTPQGSTAATAATSADENPAQELQLQRDTQLPPSAGLGR